MKDTIRAIFNWFRAEDYRTWLSHATLVLLATLGGALIGIPREAAIATFGWYLFREVEEVFSVAVWGSSVTGWLDHLMDVLAPAVVLVLVLLVTA
jgi:hypothetical protein